VTVIESTVMEEKTKVEICARRKQEEYGDNTNRKFFVVFFVLGGGGGGDGVGCCGRIRRTRFKRVVAPKL
jgi:hypothetical protein